MKISDAISLPADVHTLKAGDTIADTVDLLAEYGIGAVIVAGDDRTIDGIISERDIVRFLQHEQEGTLRIKVEDLMTRNVITCAPTDDLDQVIASMINGRFRHMPVVGDDGLCGIVSLADLAGARIAAE